MGLTLSNKPTVMDQQRKHVQIELQNFYKKITNMPSNVVISTENTEPSPKIIFSPHFDVFPFEATTPETITFYRKELLKIAKDAARRLTIGGFLIIGVKDIRIIKKHIGLWVCYLKKI